MAKRNRAWNESIYRRHLLEGRGQGSGADYTPWILVHDFSSRGMASRVKGAKTGRIHHLMSNHELYFLFLLDWSDDVLDIREQFPLLDLPEAIKIAEKAQIRYPYDKISGFPYVLTSDFFLETVNGFEIITIKETHELAKPRVREKLEIERRYWSARNIRWRIITEKEINKTKAQNIEWLSQARDLDQIGIPKRLQSLCLEYFMALLTGGRLGIEELFCEVEKAFGLEIGTGLNIYKHLIYWKQIAINISEKIDFSNYEKVEAVRTA